MLNVNVKVGDVLDEQVDVLICTANPWLNLSGGVNGALLLRGGESVQAELRNYLHATGRPLVDPGSIVRTGPGPLRVRHILHAVAIDAFYGSNGDLVATTLENALRQAVELDARIVAMPTLATGYGRLPLGEFADALRAVTRADWHPLAALTVVVRKAEHAEVLRECLDDDWPANDPDFWQMISERRRGTTIDRTELERRLDEYDASLVCYTFTLIVPAMRMTREEVLDLSDALRETGHGDWEMRGILGGFEVLFRRKGASLQEAIASAVADVESSGFRVSRIEI